MTPNWSDDEGHCCCDAHYKNNGIRIDNPADCIRNWVLPTTSEDGKEMSERLTPEREAQARNQAAYAMMSSNPSVGLLRDAMGEIDRLREDNKALREERDDLKHDIERHLNTCAELATENQALREALEFYAQRVVGRALEVASNNGDRARAALERTSK